MPAGNRCAPALARAAPAERRPLLDRSERVSLTSPSPPNARPIRRVTTSNALKVSDRWSSIVGCVLPAASRVPSRVARTPARSSGNLHLSRVECPASPPRLTASDRPVHPVRRSDPYKSQEADPEMMEKMWSDPRLHGNKKKVGTDERGRPRFQAMNGAEKRAKRAGDALSAREREYEEMLERKRRLEEVRKAEADLAEASRPSKRAKKEKKEKKDKKSKRKKDKKEKKSKDKKDRRDKKSKKSKKSRRDSSSSSSSSSSESDSESDSREKYRLSAFFEKGA